MSKKYYVILDSNPSGYQNDDFIIMGRKNHYKGTFAASCPMLFGGTADHQETAIETIIREVAEETKDHIEVNTILPKPYKYHEQNIAVHKCTNFEYDNHTTINGEFVHILKVRKGKLRNKIDELGAHNKKNFAMALYTITEDRNNPASDQHYIEYETSCTLDALFLYAKEIGLIS